MVPVWETPDAIVEAITLGRVDMLPVERAQEFVSQVVVRPDVAPMTGRDTPRRGVLPPGARVSPGCSCRQATRGPGWLTPPLNAR